MVRKTRRTRILAKDNVDTTPQRNTPDVDVIQPHQCSPTVGIPIRETNHIGFQHEVSSPLRRRHQEEPVTFENSPLQTFSNAATSYMPVAVEADDPFITMPQVHPVFTPHTPLRIHSAAHAPQPGSAESFPSPGYVASTPGDTPLQARTRGPAHDGNPNHNRSSPRSPSGNKSGNKAKDVWEFYEEAGGFNYCKFCHKNEGNSLCTEDRNYSTAETSL
ncbi:hypothetical protein BDQ17DRAFT_1327086 [Cyathus striatus]|nr:hypothetical protein BDQ17DRAFT_1327086 [Cyathus striatus]